MSRSTNTTVPRGRRVGRTRPDPDGVSYPLVGTGGVCTCAGFDGVCEPGCGVEIDDSREANERKARQ